MINKDQVQNIRIKRLRVIFPLIALAIVSLIFFQSVNITTTKEKKLNLILSDQSNDGVLKPSMIGETSSGQPFVLNALRASPLGPDLRDIELENVSITLGKEGVQTISVNSRNAKYFAKNNIAIFFDEDLIIAFFIDEICKIGSIDNNGLLGGKKIISASSIDCITPGAASTK